MENDIISLFLARKKENISTYAGIFIKYSLKNKINLNSIIDKIVDIYFDNYYLEKNLDFSLLTKYFEIGRTNESLMKDVLQSALLFYKNSGLEAQIESDIKTIVILSNIIYLSIYFDEYINEYKNGNIEIEERINNYFNIYQNKLKLSEEEFITLKEELQYVIKKDISSEKKFWKCLSSNNYILTYNRLTNKNYYWVDYRYEIKQLYRYDKQEVEKTSLTKGIIDDILSIYIEELSIFILKDLLKKNNNDYFFINIYPDYFNKNKDLLSIDRILKNDSIKNRIVFCFNIKDIEKNMNVIKYLNSKDFKIGLMGIDETAIIGTTTFDLFNFVFIDSNILNSYREYKEIWKIKNIKFVVDCKKEKVVTKEEILIENRCTDE